MTIKEEQEQKAKPVLEKLKSWLSKKHYLRQEFAEKVNAARKTAVILLLTAFIGGLLPISADQSDGPTGPDAPYLQTLIQVTNVTQSEVGWHKENEARPGDVLKYQIWYHNYRQPESGLVAKDVKISATLPSDPSKTLVTKGTVSASNANTAWDIASTNLLTDQTISYIPGSTIWKHQVNGNWIEQSLPDGIAANGVNIGDVDPCWEAQGTVSFQVKVSNPGLKVEKKVAHLGGSWTEKVKADPGQTVAYMINFTNTGSTKLNNVIVGDNLPGYMDYVSGSTTLYNANNPNGKTMPDGVTTGGLDIGHYTAGSNGYIIFKSKIKNDVPSGCHDLKNVGIAKADQTPEVWDYAYVNVCGIVEQAPEFTISKSAYNVTQDVNATTTLARSGDVIRYTLRTSNTGNTSGNYTISDDLETFLIMLMLQVLMEEL